MTTAQKIKTFAWAAVAGVGLVVLYVFVSKAQVATEKLASDMRRDGES